MKRLLVGLALGLASLGMADDAEMNRGPVYAQLCSNWNWQVGGGYTCAFVGQWMQIADDNDVQALRNQVNQLQNQVQDLERRVKALEHR